ncbi:hypothetical protein [Paracoccus rhizosphaerae]|uniref:Uncharacterized protein n=1 Tax=Paracoccus rhizosphaerae TaxID=1133347 RepID=A0ABV6CN07_9RHOB|nr:hypothetical protein [Paracoccus rhizosphaerae]
MNQPSGGIPPGEGVPVVRARFTLKTLCNLLVVFEATDEDDAVLVELGADGIWVITADGQRIFVGARHASDA